jgi:serine/threonine protein kinase
VGAVLAELHTGYVLFQNDSVASMLARITGILGPFPRTVLAAGRDTSKYFTIGGVCYERVEDVGYSLIYPKKTTLAARLHLDADNMTADDALFLDFVRQSLDVNPTTRPSAQELLNHGWLEGADELKIPAPVLSQPPPAPADYVDDEDDDDADGVSGDDEPDEDEEDDEDIDDDDDDEPGSESEDSQDFEDTEPSATFFGYGN